MGNEGSELKRSQSPHGWNTANEDLFLPILIVGSGTKAPCEWASGCLVTAPPVEMEIYDQKQVWEKDVAWGT